MTNKTERDTGRMDEHCTGRSSKSDRARYEREGGRKPGEKEEDWG